MAIDSQDELDAELKAATEATAEVKRLAAMSLLDYARARREAAKRLGFSAAILDKLVGAERGQADAAPGQGKALTFPEPNPWHEPVDGNALLDDVAATIDRGGTVGCFDVVRAGGACRGDFEFEKPHEKMRKVNASDDYQAAG